MMLYLSRLLIWSVFEIVSESVAHVECDLYCSSDVGVCISFSEIKERIKKTKDEKKAKKAEITAKTHKTTKGNMPKAAAAPKGPKLGGGGGKR